MSAGGEPAHPATRSELGAGQWDFRGPQSKEPPAWSSRDGLLLQQVAPQSGSQLSRGLRSLTPWPGSGPGFHGL